MLIIFGGGGGIIAVLGAIVIVGRGIFRQVSATEENTEAIKELTGKVETLVQGYNGHEIRIAIIEDRMKR